MKWVHAKERLPDVLPDRSEQFFVKDMRYAGIHGFSKKTCFYGVTNGSLLRQYPNEMYWLDESYPSEGEQEDGQEKLWLDAKEIFMKHYEAHNYPIQAIKEIQSKYTITRK